MVTNWSTFARSTTYGVAAAATVGLLVGILRVVHEPRRAGEAGAWRELSGPDLR
ncbi:MAG: hypothetical protein ACRD0J_09625 [Acidimicrobiales bacterium]